MLLFLPWPLPERQDLVKAPPLSQVSDKNKHVCNGLQLAAVVLKVCNFLQLS